ncbi:hypothetical protein COO60DRAFT_1609020, partial [Scenedesmus sp. NREL 46B-D3]
LSSRSHFSAALHSSLHAVLMLSVGHCVIVTGLVLSALSQQFASMQARLLADQQSRCDAQEPDCCPGRSHFCLDADLSGVTTCPL